MQMSTFNQHLLRSCIEDQPNFNSKYSYFKTQFQHSNQQWIHKTIRVFKSILTDNLSSPFKKIQTLKGIKEGLDTCEYGFVTLVEVEILPIFMDIARYRKEDFDDNRGKSLFLAGCKNSKERQDAESIGNNYLRMILECIQVWAKVKPYHIIQEYIQLQDLDSQWMRTLKQLKSENVTFPQQLIFFSPDDIDKLRRNFIQKSDAIGNNIHKYIEYYRLMLYDGLDQERNYHNQNTQHLISLYKYGDTFLLNDALKYIGYNLTEQNVSPMKKILSLRMLNQLFKSGQFNIIQFTNQLSSRLVDIIYFLDTNDNTLRRGQYLFKGDGGKRYGSIYYAELLKSLQLWAACIPYDTLGRNSPSQFVLGTQKLKEKRLELPKITSSQFSMFKEEFHRNQKRNQIKNQMLRQIQNDIDIETPGSLKTTSVASKQFQQHPSGVNRTGRKLSSQIVFTIPHFQTQNVNQRNQTLKNIFNQMQHLKSFNQIQNREWLNGSMSYIQKYCQINPSLIAGSGQNTRILIDDLDKAQKILGIYQKYNDKKISYPQFLNTVKSIHKGSYLQMIHPSEVEELKYEVNQLQQKQELQRMINKSREEIIPIHVNSLNTFTQDSHQMTVNKTAQFLPSIPSGNNIREIQPSLGYHPPHSQNYYPLVPQQHVYIPNATPFTLTQQQTIQNIPPQIAQRNSNYQSNQHNLNRLSNTSRPDEYLMKREQDQPSSKQNLSINKRQEKSESFSDAVRSKQKIVIEGFEHNLLDSKLSLLNKEESEKKIQSSMSLKNLNTPSRPGSMNFTTIPPGSMPPKSLSPPLPKPPSTQQISTQSLQQNIQKQVFSYQQNAQLFSKSSTPIHQIIGQQTIINYNSKEEDSKIVEPLLQPLNNSYYELSAIPLNSNKNIEFRNAFDSNKHYIGDNRSPSKIMWEKEAVLLRSHQQQVGGFNVPRALNDLELHHSGQVINLQQHYQKIIQNLEGKISSLSLQLQQSQQANLYLSKQLDTVRGSLAYSKPYTSRQGKDQSLKVSRFHNLYSPPKYTLKQPQGKKINESNYGHLFSIKDTSIKKTMIKNKDLLLKNSTIEVGFMISKEEHLKISLFILPYWNISSFTFQINNPSNFKIRLSSPPLSSNIEAQKQHKLIFQIQSPFVSMFPLQIPSINISFKQSNSKQSFQYQLLLPSSINRFIDYSQIQDVNAFTYLFQNFPNIHSTKQHLLNTKIIKQPNAIVSLLPKFKFITGVGNDLVYGSQAHFNSLRFFVRCVVRPNNSIYWQAIDQSKTCPQKLIEEYLATMLWLFSH